VIIYHGTSVLLCGVSFVSVAEPQFLLYVLRKLQRFLVTDFVVEVKVSCMFVESNKTFPYTYHFIRKCCVFHMYVTVAVGNGRSVPKLLRRSVHGAAQGKLFGFPRNSVQLIIKL